MWMTRSSLPLRRECVSGFSSQCSELLISKAMGWPWQSEWKWSLPEVLPDGRKMVERSQVAGAPRESQALWACWCMSQPWVVPAALGWWRALSSVLSFAVWEHYQVTGHVQAPGQGLQLPPVALSQLFFLPGVDLATRECSWATRARTDHTQSSGHRFLTVYLVAPVGTR